MLSLYGYCPNSFSPPPPSVKQAPWSTFSDPISFISFLTLPKWAQKCIWVYLNTLGGGGGAHWQWLEHFVLHSKSFSWIPHLPTFSSFGLVVDGTVDGKNNKEEKAWEVADIMIYHFSWKILQVGCDMQWWWWLTWKFFILPTCLITFKSRVLMVNDTLDGKDNLEEKTREVADK